MMKDSFQVTKKLKPNSFEIGLDRTSQFNDDVEVERNSSSLRRRQPSRYNEEDIESVSQKDFLSDRDADRWKSRLARSEPLASVTNSSCLGDETSSIQSAAVNDYARPGDMSYCRDLGSGYSNLVDDEELLNTAQRLWQNCQSNPEDYKSREELERLLSLHGGTCQDNIQGNIRDDESLHRMAESDRIAIKHAEDHLTMLPIKPNYEAIAIPNNLSKSEIREVVYSFQFSERQIKAKSNYWMVFLPQYVIDIAEDNVDYFLMSLEADFYRFVHCQLSEIQLSALKLHRQADEQTPEIPPSPCPIDFLDNMSQASARDNYVQTQELAIQRGWMMGIVYFSQKTSFEKKRMTMRDIAVTLADDERCILRHLKKSEFSAEFKSVLTKMETCKGYSKVHVYEKGVPPTGYIYEECVKLAKQKDFDFKNYPAEALIKHGTNLRLLPQIFADKPDFSITEEKLRSLAEKKTCGIYVYGPPGTGKTFFAYVLASKWKVPSSTPGEPEKSSGVSRGTQNKFSSVEDKEIQKIKLHDDMSAHRLDSKEGKEYMQRIIEESDIYYGQGYGARENVKGGFVSVNYDFIIITSNSTVFDYINIGIDPESIKALLRRFTLIFFPSRHQKPIISSPELMMSYYRQLNPTVSLKECLELLRLTKPSEETAKDRLF